MSSGKSAAYIGWYSLNELRWDANDVFARIVRQAVLVGDAVVHDCNDVRMVPMQPL